MIHAAYIVLQSSYRCSALAVGCGMNFFDKVFILSQSSHMMSHLCQETIQGTLTELFQSSENHLVVLKRTDCGDLYNSEIIVELNDAACHLDFMHDQAFLIF